MVQYFDLSGNLIAEQAVNSVSTDGTTLSAVTPNFSELEEGTYAGVINNIGSDGSYIYAGTVAVTINLPIYRPTAYSDMGTNDPSIYDGWIPSTTPAGPTTGAFIGAPVAGNYTASVNAADDYQYAAETWTDYPLQGQCTWSAFPSHVDTNNLTLYIPYGISTDFYGGNAYYTVAATIGGSTTTLYSGPAVSGIGLLTASVPAGTNLSSIQVSVTASPNNTTAIPFTRV